MLIREAWWTRSVARLSCDASEPSTGTGRLPVGCAIVLWVLNGIDALSLGYAHTLPISIAFWNYSPTKSSFTVSPHVIVEITMGHRSSLAHYLACVVNPSLHTRACSGSSFVACAFFDCRGSRKENGCLDRLPWEACPFTSLKPTMPVVVHGIDVTDFSAVLGSAHFRVLGIWSHRSYPVLLTTYV
jgi:hypothetical protein